MIPAKRPEQALDGHRARQAGHGGFHDPAPHPALEPAVEAPCPACGMPVGFRRGVPNKHRLRGGPLGLRPGERPSPLGPDGWCRATAG